MTVFCVGLCGILSKNYIIEWKMVNGSIDVVRDIVYDNQTGHNTISTPFPSYVIFEFINAL